MRVRDKRHHLEDIYTVVDEIGRGGLCRICRIRKKVEKVGGSSRPENTRRKFLRQKKPAVNLVHPVAIEPIEFALKEINLTLVNEDKIDSLKNEVEYVYGRWSTTSNCGTRILKTLDHMNIIKAYETFHARDSRKLMIVMELCMGGDLFSRIPYDEPTAADVTRQILSAVSYIHDRKIVHRDLKFENIIFESRQPQSLIKVIDFGLSKE